ncbi:MAG TPA: hypothetical protein VLK25_07995 [Allosphingosinicella sp.]|nr:hypothetical protein [Allosphingosinicella sp.]
MNPLLLLAASFAQQAPPVSAFPYAIEATIMEADGTDPETGHPSDVYPLLLSAGTRYRFTATGSGDTESLTLELRAPGEPQYIATDSAFAPPLTVALTYGPPATGLYLVRVSSTLPGNSSLETAPYTLTVTPLAANALPLAPAPAETRPATWRVWEASLTATDPDDVQGRSFHEYRLGLGAGRETMITAERVTPGAPGADDEGHRGLELSVRAAVEQDPWFDRIGYGDGSATGPAAAAVRPERSGDYIVRVMAPLHGAPMPYRLSVSE